MVIKRDKAFFADNREVVFVSDDTNIRTRLGDDRVEVRFEEAQASPFGGDGRVEGVAVALRWLGGEEVGVRATGRGGGSGSEGGFWFGVGERRFLYDRLGLRRLG